MISPKKIVYNNRSNEDFNLICDLCFEGGDDGETDSFLSRKAVTTETYNGSFRRGYDMKYENVLTPQITLMKKNFEDFTFEEQRAVLAWLTGRRTTSYMDVYMDEEPENLEDYEPTYCLLGGVTEVKTYKLGNNRTVGVIFTFESLYPYALSPLKKIKDHVCGTRSYILPCKSDELEALVYPKITITHKSYTIPTSKNNINTKLIEKFFYDNTYGTLITVLNGKAVEISMSNSESQKDAECEPYYQKYYYIKDKKILVQIDKNDKGNYYSKTITEYFGTSVQVSFLYNAPKMSKKDALAKISKNTIFIDSSDNNYYFKYKKSIKPINICTGLPEATEDTENDFYYDKLTRAIYKGKKYKGIFSGEYDYYWSPIAYQVNLNRSIDMNVRGSDYDETIVIDGANRVISSSNKSRIFGEGFNWNWLSLRHGENTIEVTGNCDITFEWRDPIKIGQF